MEKIVQRKWAMLVKQVRDKQKQTKKQKKKQVRDNELLIIINKVQCSNTIGREIVQLNDSLCKLSQLWLTVVAQQQWEKHL